VNLINQNLPFEQRIPRDINPVLNCPPLVKTQIILETKIMSYQWSILKEIRITTSKEDKDLSGLKYTRVNKTNSISSTATRKSKLAIV